MRAFRARGAVFAMVTVSGKRRRSKGAVWSRGAAYKLVDHFSSLKSSPSQRPPIHIDVLSAVCQDKFTRSIDQVTNKIPK